MKNNTIIYIAALSVFSFLIFSKNPMVLIPAGFFLLSLYFPVDRIKLIGVASAIAGIILFLSYLSQSLSEASGILLSFLIVAEYVWKGSGQWREWVHISALLLMADSAIYGLGLIYFLLSLSFVILSLWQIYQALYPAGNRRIIKFLPVHLMAILIFTPIIFLSIPRKSTFFMAGGYRRTSGLADFVDLNFSGRIRESTAIAMEIEGEKIPVYWKARVFYIYRKGQWLSGERGIVKSGKKILNRASTLQLVPALKIKYLLKFPRLIPFPYGTTKIFLHENGYWSHRDYFEFGGSIRRYGVWIEPEQNAPIQFIRQQRDGTIRILGEENPYTFRKVILYLPEREWKEIDSMAQKLRGKNLEETISNIENFLNENYTYTTRVELLESEPVYNFLFITKRGHCELFATATAVLLKALGWNARYVSGFRLRERGEGWAIARMRDAHAWVEIWDGRKWIPFDPSPGKTWEEAPASGIFPTFWGKINDLWVRYVVGFSSSYQINAFRWVKKNHRKIVFLILALILIFILIKVLSPQSMEKSKLQKYRGKYPWYYRKLLGLARRTHLRKPPYYTPLEFGRLMGNEGEEIIKFYYKERFGKMPLSEDEIQKIKEELRKIENRIKGAEGKN